MKRTIVALLAMAAPLAASAQANAPVVATPLPPANPGAGPPAPQAPAAPAPASAWLPQPNATLQVLDKVNAQTAVLTVKVGQSVKVGTLNIEVKACDIRPPDQPQDSTAYLAITDSISATPAFSGWMLAGNPSLSMLQHPIYDVRVTGCKA